MSGRKIYSAELKLEIVQRYLKGDIGIKKLAQEYHVTFGDIQKWRDAYQEHGVAGLNTTHGTYTGGFKVSVVEYMHNTGASIRKTAAHF
ncbi:MAG: transposase, partial [Hespellia sp.]|nr:transposase [Hespellia sp.]